MYWNYRLIEMEHFTEDDALVKLKTCNLFECYYDDDGTIIGWIPPWDTKPFGETPEELRRDLERMIHATTTPILSEQDFPPEPLIDAALVIQLEDGETMAVAEDGHSHLGAFYKANG